MTLVVSLIPITILQESRIDHKSFWKLSRSSASDAHKPNPEHEYAHALHFINTFYDE